MDIEYMGKGGVDVIRKFMRVIFALLGAALGYGVTRLIQDII